MSVVLRSTHPYPRETILEDSELVYECNNPLKIKSYLLDENLYTYLEHANNLSFQIVTPPDIDAIERNFFNQGAIDGDLPPEIREDLQSALSAIS